MNRALLAFLAAAAAIAAGRAWNLSRRRREWRDFEAHDKFNEAVHAALQAVEDPENAARREQIRARFSALLADCEDTAFLAFAESQFRQQPRDLRRPE